MNGQASVDLAMAKIKELKARQAELEEAERFLEAEEVVHQISDTSKQLLVARERETKQKQVRETQMVQDSYKGELRDFKRAWDQRLKDLQVEQNSLREQLLSAQEKELKTKTEWLEGSLPVNYKPSSYLLTLIKTKQKAVKSKQYPKAETLKRTIETLQIEEQRTFHDIRSDKIKRHLSYVRGKFDKEMNNFEVKQKAAFDELTIKKNQEYEQLVKKFNNIRRELQDAQHAEINCVTGKYTNGVKRNPSGTPIKLVSATTTRFVRTPCRSYTRASYKGPRRSFH